MPDEVVVIQTTEEDIVVVESAAEDIVVEDAGEVIVVEAPDQYPNPRITVSDTPPANPDINDIWVGPDDGSGGGGGAVSLDGLNDVVITAPSSGQVLKYNGSEWVNAADDTGGGGGVTDHGALTGLSDDDHTQYHNDARGDARYSQLGHNHVKADITDFSHTHVKADITDFSDSDYAPALGPDDNYVTDAEKTKLANLSGTNTGDQDLSGKQDVLVSGTNIKTVNSNSLLGAGDLAISGNIDRSSFIEALKFIGATIYGSTAGLSGASFVSQTINDGLARFVAVWVPDSCTVTGVKFYQRVQGVYTADNENSLSLYSFSGTSFTQVATTGDNGDLWKGAANTWQSVGFTSTVSLSRGVYFVCELYNSSAQTTQPAIAIPAAWNPEWDLPDGLRTSFQKSFSSAPASFTYDGTFAAASTPFVYLLY